MEKSSLGRSLVPGLQTYAFCAVTQPRRFFLGRPFGYVWTLYAATYAVANCSETLATKLHEAAVGIVAVASVFLVNVPLGIWKDIRFSQIYGAGVRSQQSQPKAVTPANSRKGVAAFLFRDGLTIGTSFALAPALASAVPDTVTSNPHTKAMITQLTVPMIGQMFSTPIHLLGLDFFTRPDSAKASQRLSRAKKDIPAATTIRCMRILPTFGFGCILNRDLRKLFSGNEINS